MIIATGPCWVRRIEVKSHGNCPAAMFTFQTTELGVVAEIAVPPARKRPSNDPNDTDDNVTGTTVIDVLLRVEGVLTTKIPEGSGRWSVAAETVEEA